MYRKKVLMLLLAVLVMCSLLTSYVMAETEINVGIQAGSQYTIFYKELVKDFTAKTGIKVNFIDVPHNNMHERFLTEAMAGTGAIDVFQADQPWVAEFAAYGFLEPIGKKLQKADRNDYLPTALATETYKGEIYALPYIVHNSVLFYRTDLFKEAGLNGPPTTWEEYKAYARKLTKDTNNDGKVDIYGTVIEGKEAIEPACKFMDLLFQAGGEVLNKKGKAVFNSKASINAFKLIQDIQFKDKTSPPGAGGFDNADTHYMFLQGNLAMAPNWPYMYSMAIDPAKSKVAGKFKVALQPGKKAVVTSWGFGISSASKKKDAAWKFVQWTSSKDVLVKLGSGFIQPVPRKSATDIILKNTSIDQEKRDAIAVMTESISISPTLPMIPEWPTIHARIARGLSKIMSQQTTPEAEAKAIDADIKKTLKQ